MKKDQLFLSTIAPDAAEEARRHGLGLEIAEYCTAWNMDEQFETTHAAVTEELTGVGRRLLHAPFSELFPCAVDPKARELAALRYRQAIALARRYDARKIIIHGGFNERLYYPCWYTEQSIVFWKDFLKEDPGVDIVLENVLEEQPEITDDDAVKEITGDGLGAANDANWTYTQTYRDYRTDPDSPLDPMGVVISPMLDDYQHARYVRLRIHASYTNKTYNPTFRGWCIAELNVWGNNELLE